jgi:hypothetical protein
MTQDEIIFMARASGWMSEYESSTGFSAEAAITFAKLVAQHEREACAKVCDEHCGWTPRMIGETIRARSNA